MAEGHASKEEVITTGTTVLREVALDQAIGLRLGHDLTQIVPGVFKGRLFKRGHLITEEDVPALLNIGKEHIYVMELGDGELHEDDAAIEMAKALADDSLIPSEPHEGKVSLKAAFKGMVVIDREIVDAINAMGEIALATVVGNKPVEAGGSVAATRAIPLVVSKEKVEKVKALAAEYRKTSGGASPLRIVPFRKLKAGLLTTGSEIYHGRIMDKFGPAIVEKLAFFGCEVAEQRFAPDKQDIIINEIGSLVEQGYDMILVTGGMSVDPDDRTPGAIAAAGAEIVSYGTPMLPGSMLLMGYIGEVPIMGLPGCVMHDPYTSFDALLPRIVAGIKIGKEDITALGYGGLLGC
ncbi:molybdopterin-binding protein [Paenibacillus sp. CAU 1782]